MDYLRGIDVSRHQGDIDWARLRPHVDEVIVRATLGRGGVDTHYRRNWREIVWAAFPQRGLYHYYITEDPPDTQLDNIFHTTGGDFGNRPFTVDCERRADERIRPFDRIAYTRNLERFLNGWKGRTRHPIRIYTSAAEWRQITTEPAWLADYDLHIAHYNSFILAPALPRYARGWQVWQWDNTGHLPGIAGNVDLNRVKGALPPPAEVLLPRVRTAVKMARELLR
jgi:lysozyme